MSPISEPASAVVPAIPEAPPAPAPVTIAPAPVTATTPTPALATPTTAPAHAPATTAAPTGAAPPASPPAGAEGGGYPYLVGPPGLRLGTEMAASAGVEKKSAQPDFVAPAAPAAAQYESLRPRRPRTELIDRGYRHEYLESDLDSAVAASERGAVTVGFPGVAPDANAAPAAGLTTLAGDSLGGGATMPMIPASWEPGPPHEPKTGLD